MPGKNFLLLSMEDEKIKKISNVISNESCRKILDYLSNKDATESELAEKLDIPISTVHYNLQQLRGTGLIEAKEFHYSEKGKEVNHYKLANKYIIIAPKKTYGIKEKLKGILPVALIAAGVGFIVQILSNYYERFPAVSKTMAERAMADAAESGAPAMVQAAEVATKSGIQSYIGLWFFAGASFALAVYLLVSIIRKKPEA